jgi:hypothetical protein
LKLLPTCVSINRKKTLFKELPNGRSRRDYTGGLREGHVGKVMELMDVMSKRSGLERQVKLEGEARISRKKERERRRKEDSTKRNLSTSQILGFITAAHHPLLLFCNLSTADKFYVC